MTFFSCRLATTPELPSSDILLSSVLRKFGHKELFFILAVRALSPVFPLLLYNATVEEALYV